MKRIVSFALMLLLLALCACGSEREQQASVPTERMTESPTAEPTAVPTGKPTPEPTEKPDFSGLIPQTGRLCEGPIFPEPGKYLVLSAGGGLFLVFDNMGELIKTFNAVEDDSAFGSPGIYGEEGICEGVRISTGEDLGIFSHFDDIVLKTAWTEKKGKWKCSVTEVFDKDFNLLFSFDDADEGCVGDDGGILHLGDDYLFLDRHCVYHGSKAPELVYNSPIRVFGSDGSRKADIDPKRFPRQIMGVLGGKYLICGSAEPQRDPYYFWESHELSIWDISGKMLMDNVMVSIRSTYTVEAEGGYGVLLAGDYLEDEHGFCYNSELEIVPEIPEGADIDPFYERYGVVNLPDVRVFDYDGYVFSGVMDMDGKWLFRIYNPKFASDNIPNPWNWF